MKAAAGNTPGKRTTVRIGLPLYCDYHCPHSSFAPADATGACRREQGVYCNILGRFNTKNSPCKARPGNPHRAGQGG
jgi:predicted ArsR family transcriptional regulator